jgi:recombination protein RecA
LAKKFDLNKYKEKIKATDTPLKDDKLIPMTPALQAISGLQGLPLGHVVQVYGPSNGGKSSLAYYFAKEAQSVGVLPIFITTEGKVSTERMKLMGIDMDNVILDDAEYIEGVFKKLDQYVSDQASGELPTDILLIVDSIGNTISESSVTINKDGTTELGGAMMKASKVIRENMRVMSHKINNTRKVNSKFSAGLLFVNHSYKQPPQFPGGPTLDVAAGGDGITYSSSLIIKVKKSKMLKATKNGVDVTFGLVSKLSIEKNHINGISNQGEFVIVPDGVIPNEKGAIDEYKASHKDSWSNFKTEDGELLDE